VMDMALTPEDVVNKRFNPTKFREGYDQDEVDDFLDEVVVELRRLGQENEELRQRLVQSDQRIQELQRQLQSAPAAGAAPAVAAAPAPAVVAAPEPAFAPAPVAEPAFAPAAAAPVGADAMDPGNTNNLLQLARRLHEEHVREGMEKRDALIAEGHATAARVVSEAQEGARAQLGSIEQEKASLEQARDRLQQEKSTLEGQVEQLRGFEREYRQKLRAYIEGQLRDLDQTPELPAGTSASAAQEAPAETPVPTAAQQPAQPAQVGAPPAQGVPAYPGAQPANGFGGYGQPSEYQGFAGGN
jgi:DivIVA domain-containing protein